jgi:hypothetical protein
MLKARYVGYELSSNNIKFLGGFSMAEVDDFINISDQMGNIFAQGNIQKCINLIYIQMFFKT